MIELLVVVAIIAMLIAILMPALKQARMQSKIAVCMSNERSVGVAIQAYALQNRDAIPRGPADAMFFFPTQGWDQWATNQVWLGDNPAGADPMRTRQGLGAILDRDLGDPSVLFCPADDSSDPTEELEKIESRGEDDAFCSYFYRQLDQTTRDRLDNLGVSDVDLPARALLLDANSLGGGVYRRTNHKAAVVNILFLDGHAKPVRNKRNVFSLRAEDYAGFPASIETRLNQIVVAADFAETGDPLKRRPRHRI